MKKLIFLPLLFLFALPVFAQQAATFHRHQVQVDLGSLRNRYLYPMTNLSYASPLVGNINLRFSARLRSYGTLFFFSRSAYDFTPIAEYCFTDEVKPVYFSAGLGLHARLRLVNDIRSEAKHSVEPLLSLGIHLQKQKFSLKTPLWTRFYTNGISFTLLPEASWQFSERFAVLLRYEISNLRIYRAATHEWRQDLFLGVGFRI